MLTREEEKKRKQICTTKKNTEGKEQKENPLCVRSKSLGTKNSLSYSRSSDLRIYTGRVKKRQKKCIKVKQINKRKKNKDTFFFAFTFYQTRSGCIT
jgi:hypothetical protein